MNTTGGLVLLLAIGLITLVYANTASELFGEAAASNNTEIQQAASGGETTSRTIIVVFGGVALFVGAMAAIKAFS